MPINVLTLPRNAQNSIFRFLEDRSLFRLRRVSRKTKDIVDMSLLNVKSTLVFTLCVEREALNSSGRKVRLKISSKTEMKLMEQQIGMYTLEINNS
ncbi:hypothetical protein PRIPAC_74552, partial [Pristionchus pacificus]|uniref:F-box domain-containing protein n=1 Tax=Pristionchus pacificus TaxID=54126 RepID=A0A2A6C0V4_PRIPA